jgi:hypothetical protein
MRVLVPHLEELIKIREGTALSVRSLVNPGPMTCGLAAIQTKQTKQVWICNSYLAIQDLQFATAVWHGNNILLLRLFAYGT